MYYYSFLFILIYSYFSKVNACELYNSIAQLMITRHRQAEGQRKVGTLLGAGRGFYDYYL